MQATIFNVTHGFCAYIIADNKNVILIDCGHNEKTGFRPSEYLVKRGCTAVESFVLSNYDHDHVSDLKNLRDKLPISVLFSNRSVNVDTLENDKKNSSYFLPPGLLSMFDMMRNYNHDCDTPDYGDINLRFFSNNSSLFSDTNNLSMVTFLNYHNTHIVFPGDLEAAGWEKLLLNQNFVIELQKVNIFIASHHGRESGYCEKVFDYCSPEIIIISDSTKEYETQETYNDYKKHAKGIPDGDETRYIYTTRSDGHIVIEADETNATIKTGQQL